MHPKPISSSARKKKRRIKRNTALIILCVVFLISNVITYQLNYFAATDGHDITTTSLSTNTRILNNQPTSFAVVIVHCKEDKNMTAWFYQIPTDWDLTLYETCQRQAFPQYNSIQFKNAGSEECSAYLDYVLQHRDHLADITVFLQTDSFRKDGNRKKIPVGKNMNNITGHSPFVHFDELVKATHEAMVHPGQQKFLHYGWPFVNFEVNMNPAVRHNQPYMGKLLPEMWDIFATAQDGEGKYINANHNFTGKLRTRPGAIFAVHRDRILANPSSTYQNLKDTILTSKIPDDTRKRCCSMENMWHALFGEPSELPKDSTVDQYYEGYQSWEY